MNETLRLVLIYYNIFGGGFALVLALGQLSLEYRSRNNYLLACYFLLNGVWMILGSIVHLKGADWFPFNIYSILLPGFFASIPLLYFYGEGIIDHRFRISPFHALHFVLPALSLLLLLPFSIDRINLYNATNLLQHHNYSTEEFVSTVVMYMSMAAAVVYMLFIIRDTRRLMHQASDSQNRSIRIVLYVAISLIAICVFWIVDRILSLDMPVITYAVVSSMMIGCYLTGNRYPEMMLTIQLEAENARYTRSQIEKLDAEKVISQIERLMNVDKAFLADSISLKELAEKLGITAHQLSEILNRKLNKNFNQMLNEYRIAEAKEILAKDRDRKILAVAYDVGYNSPSAFYKAFQKYVGMTPSLYRQQHTA